MDRSVCSNLEAHVSYVSLSNETAALFTRHYNVVSTAGVITPEKISGPCERSENNTVNS
jgi:hypothetical protein